MPTLSIAHYVLVTFLKDSTWVITIDFLNNLNFMDDKSEAQEGSAYPVLYCS